jgi:3-deoxy-D-manno-octulosonic-acid transferase
VFVTGNLKIDRPPQDFAAARATWRERLEASSITRVIVAGSTHPGEATAIGRAARELESEGRNVRLVIAPRHREKLEIAERELESAGFAPVRWTAMRESARTPRGGEAVVIDTMGELAAAYAAADVAFVGGTLVAGVGGHNVFEPALAGTPTVVGPHLENVRADAAFLENCGALAVVANESELRAALGAALADAGGRMRAAAEAAVTQARGAADRTCDVIEECLLREPTR